MSVLLRVYVLRSHLIRDIHPRTNTKEGKHRQASCVSGGSTSGQYVVGTRTIVTQYLAMMIMLAACY